MRLFTAILLLLVSVILFSAFIPDEKKKIKIPKLKTYFACKQDGRIVMTAEQFREFMNTPMCAKDSLDSIYTVTKYEIMYAETGLYQDSAGLPIVHTDYQFGHVRGDTLSALWKSIFVERAYRGDTIKIMNVRATGTTNMPFRSSDIELILR